MLERHDTLQALGSVIGIMPSGTRVLQHLGLLDEVWRVCGDRKPVVNWRRWEDGSVLMTQTPPEREGMFGIRCVMLIVPLSLGCLNYARFWLRRFMHKLYRWSMVTDILANRTM